MKAAIITIGDEILLGQIIDTNSVWLTKQLANSGFDVSFMMTVSDKRHDIEQAVKIASEQSDLIIMTGGLGPTKDDVTKKTLADYFGLHLEFDDALFKKISDYFALRKIPVTELHRNQCLMPVGCQILENNMGTAPGMLFHSDSTILLSLPGVPYEMEWIFTHSFTPLIPSLFPSLGKIYYKTIRTAGVGETTIAGKIEDIEDGLPQGISLAYLPSLGQVKLRLTSRDSDSQIEVVNNHVDAITDRLGNIVYGFDETTLEEALMHQFMNKSLKLSTAESCTGGFLAHKLTSVPGSSEYYEGGFVSYSNALKSELLGVSPDTLKQHGAVSEQTVLEMLNGLLKSTSTDVGIAISGIAGPGGGTATKPVGTVWFAWGTRDNQKTQKLQLSKNRLKNIEYSVSFAMNSLRLFLTEL